MPDTDDDRGEVAIPIPDGYDAGERAAFLAGFEACAELFGTAAASYAAAASDERDGRGGAGGNEDGDGDDVTECPECDAPLLDSMGAEETVTPAGRVCPNCEL